jgi:hypothetical protein
MTLFPWTLRSSEIRLSRVRPVGEAAVRSLLEKYIAVTLDLQNRTGQVRIGSRA